MGLPNREHCFSSQLEVLSDEIAPVVSCSMHLASALTPGLTDQKLQSELAMQRMSHSQQFSTGALLHTSSKYAGLRTDLNLDE